MTPTVSVFTPSHDPKYLMECYESLRQQSFTDWEWVVLINGEVKRPFDFSDPRVKMYDISPQVVGVGEAKARCVALCTGEILVELDHDDTLRPDCLAQIAFEFEKRPEVGFVYSDWAQVNAGGDPDHSTWSPDFGWMYIEIPGGGHLTTLAFEPSPHNVSYIWYAPNHVRAFTRWAYDKAGGYDPERDILDDQDLMARLYQVAPFHHIDQCLYFQRVHEGNTQKDPEINARIQRETVELYDRDIQANALAWAGREGLKVLDLGGAHNSPEGYLVIDRRNPYHQDNVYHCDVSSEPLPFEDSTIGVIRAVDFLEHIPDKIALFNELYRVLAHGGMLLSLTPSTDGRGAFQDPTHVAYYNENSFWYWTDAEYAKYVPEIKCRFQVSRLVTYYPSAWHEEHDIPYVCANLIAIKDGPRQGGILSI